MKKMFLSFALVAVAATMMASSNNVFTTGETAAPVADEVPIDEQKELTCDVYSVKVPEGWTARSRVVSRTCVMGLNDEPFTYASFSAVSYNDVSYYQKSKQEDGFSVREEKMKVGDHEFVIMDMEDEDGHFNIFAVTSWGEDGSISVKMATGNCTLSQDEKKTAIEANLQTILKNLTIKTK